MGNDYLRKDFPALDYWRGCKRRAVVEEQVHARIAATEAAATEAAATEAAATEAAATHRFVLKLAPGLGDVVVELDKSAPLGFARLLDMLTTGYLDGARFFRVVPGFVVQFGLPADPSTAKQYARIKDDPVVKSNARGVISFASAGPNSRSNQLFINLGNNKRLDSMGFAPVGRVVSGMEFVDRIESKYGEQPDQGRVTREGVKYMDALFPDLSYIHSAKPVLAAASETLPPQAPVVENAGDDQARDQLRGGKQATPAEGPPLGAGIAIVFLAVIVAAFAFGIRMWKTNVVRFSNLLENRRQT